MDGLNVVLLKELQAEALVPALGVDINADLTANGKLQPRIRELLPQGFHKLDANLVFLNIKSKTNLHLKKKIRKKPYSRCRSYAP